MPHLDFEVVPGGNVLLRPSSNAGLHSRYLLQPSTNVGPLPSSNAEMYPSSNAGLCPSSNAIDVIDHLGTKKLKEFSRA